MQSVNLAAGHNVKSFHYRCDEYIIRFSSLLLLYLHLLFLLLLQIYYFPFMLL